MEIFAGLGILWILMILAFGFFMLASCIWGLILSFRASIVLGIICLFLEVPFPIFAWAHWFAGVDLAQRIVDRLPDLLGK